MRITILLAASACLLAAVLANTSQRESRLLRLDPNLTPGDAALMEFAHGRGAALYTAHCASCHGMSGQGDMDRGIPNLNDDDWLYGAGSVSDIEQIIKFGIRSYHPKAWNVAIMPAYATERPSSRNGKTPSLSPGEIRDLVEFLMREQRRSADGPAAVRGADLFRGAGGCYDCHAMDGKGDAAIGAPNLTDAITLYGDGSREALSMSIARGRRGMCPAWVRHIGPAGIRELALFVYALSHPGKAAQIAPPADG